MAPGPERGVGAFQRMMTGNLWRDAWTAEVAVEVLDRERFHEGFAADSAGNSFLFTPLVHDTRKIFPLAAQTAFSQKTLNDLLSATYPYADAITGVIAAAAGWPQAQPSVPPRLAFFPDAEIPGGGTGTSAGQMGYFTAYHDTSAIRGYATTLATLAAVYGGNGNLIDAREVLKVRLLDFYLGIWYGATESWVWAPSSGAGPTTWRPVQFPLSLAFSRFDGVVTNALGIIVTPLVSCDEEYPDVSELAWYDRGFDRKVLSSLTRRTYDSLALDLVQSISDSVIDAAIDRIPPERRPVDGPRLRRILQQRRAQLPALAQAYYAMLARTVDVYATDAPKWVEVRRLDAQRLSVTISAKKADGSPDKDHLQFARIFSAGETEEIRLYMAGGDDQVNVHGAPANPIIVRVVRGKGNDVILDSTASSRPDGGNAADASDHAGRVLRHDDSGTKVLQGPGLRMEFGGEQIEVGPTESLAGEYEDRGSAWTPEIMADWNAEYGPLLGAGLDYYRYGFRQHPYAWMFGVKGGFAPFGGNGRVQISMDSRVLLPGASVGFSALVSGYELSEYFGVGNESERRSDVGAEYYRPHLRQYRFVGSVCFPVSSPFQVTLSGTAKFVRAALIEDRYVNLVRPYGVDGLAFFGAGGVLSFDTREYPANPQQGVFLEAGGMVYPASHGLSESFSKTHGDVRGFVGGIGTPAVTFAFRAFGEKSWGNVPFFELPSLGGWHGLRGLSIHRFVGDALALGSMELRASLWNVNLLVPSTMGVAGFIESGRVFARGESSTLWHGSYGGSLWFAPWSRDNTVTVAVAGSAEGMEVYLDVGLGF
jgi:hypothetical protein